MRKLLLATTILIGSSFGAFAEGHSGDAYDWRGIYVGGFLGYGSGDTRWFNAFATTPTFNMDGWLGGVAVGVNFQVDQFVFGAEADVAAANIDGRFVPPPCITGCITDLKAYGTVRARAGWAVNMALLYVTGGYAWGHIEETLGVVVSSSTRSGWTVGGGVDWAFDGGPLGGGWFARAEYQYLDFSSRLITPLGVGINVNADDFHIGRIGIFKKF